MVAIEEEPTYIGLRSEHAITWEIFKDEFHK
jgi:hypothetical protein